jgi:hypothetical protein
MGPMSIGESADMMRDVIRVGRMLRLTDAEVCVARCKSIDHLIRLHDQWTNKLNSMTDHWEGDVSFCFPPVSGNDDIIPITNSHMLNMEGRVMSHCVASDRDKILAGRCYIYRVLAPQRATLELVRSDASRSSYYIGQLQLKGNATPYSLTFAIVQKWLDEGLRELGGD